MSKLKSTVVATALVALPLLPALHGAPATAQFGEKDIRGFIRPTEGREQTLPMTVRWDGLEGAHYAVFVDAAPVGPGQDLKDRSKCPEGQFGCTPSQVLNLKGIYLTDAPSIELTRVGNSLSPRLRHWVTVVRLDDNGTRIGEDAWSTSFILKGGENS